MNKITTKLRTIGRLLGWVSLSFGIVIAMSQMANAFIIVNRNEGQSQVWWDKNPNDWFGKVFYDGKQEFGHHIWCGGTDKKCGSGKGIDLQIVIYPTDSNRYRIEYPLIYVPPFGILEFYKWGYYVSDNEAIPSTIPILHGEAECWHLVPQGDPNGAWAYDKVPLADCDPFNFPARYIK